MNPVTSTGNSGGGPTSLYWAVLIILLGLISMTSSHIKAIRDHAAIQNEKNRKDTELLEKAGERGRQAEKLNAALRKLASTNMTAARIMEDFFPASPPQAPDFKIRQQAEIQQAPATK